MSTLLASMSIEAAPEGATIISGDVQIDQVDNATIIHQSTHKGVINWHTFNVNGNESVHFQQPSADSITLNRVTGGQGASQIYGSITATGNVWILNPDGVHFGPDAVVDVAGVLASTYDIANQDFLDGRYNFKAFEGEHAGKVLNEGKIIVSGLAAMLSHDVENIGLIHVNLGTIMLGSNPSHVIDYYGNDSIYFTVDDELVGKQATISNSGDLIADGGHIFITADQAESVMGNVINITGYISADAVDMQAGVIVLRGGANSLVDVSGDISAAGGRAHLLGELVGLFDDARIDVSGPLGGEILIGGDYQGKGLIPTAHSTYIGDQVRLYADGYESDAGRIIAWADGYTAFHGEAYARALGSEGDGGFIETSGKIELEIGENVFVSTASENGEYGMWLLDPENFTVDNTLAGTINTRAPSNVTIFASEGITFSNTKEITLTKGTNLYAKAGDEILFTTSGIAINDSDDKSEVCLISDCNSDGVVTLSFAGTGNVTATDGASATEARNSGPGFDPIGDSSNKFTGPTLFFESFPGSSAVSAAVAPSIPAGITNANIYRYSMPDHVAFSLDRGVGARASATDSLIDMRGMDDNLGGIDLEVLHDDDLEPHDAP